MSAGERRKPEIVETKLALAIRLVDAYTDRPLPVRGFSTGRRIRPETSGHERRTARRRTTSGAPTVTIGDVDVDPVVNPSGYLLYFEDDLPPELDEIDLKVTGGGRYVDEQVSVDLSERDPQDPEVIELQPLPAYRFPAGATLLRGHVLVVDEEDVDEDEIRPERFGEEGVTVSIPDLDQTTETVAGGEFVLFVTGITPDGVDDDGLVQVDGDAPRLELQDDTFENEPIPVDIAEGETRCYQIKHDSNEEEDVTYRECGAETWTAPPS